MPPDAGTPLNTSDIAPDGPVTNGLTGEPATVAQATFAALRALGVSKMFANPGSTEIPFLRQLPPDIDFVLGLHESAVVGMASGFAIGTGRPSLVLLHTTAGLGNAVGAIATARVNRTPLVVVVGQQDRRHLALEPFLAGQLDGLAGQYPVWFNQPLVAADVPGAVARAYWEAATRSGPALVIVPMDDWDAPAGDGPAAAPAEVRIGNAPYAADLDALAEVLAESSSPALVAGSGADDARTWAAVAALADHLDAPVWQEAFGARAGVAQDHPRFAGHLPASRSRLRATLAPYDVVLVIGAPAFRLYPYEGGPLVAPGTRLALVTAWADEALHSPVDLAIVASPADVLEGLVTRLPARPTRTHDRVAPEPPAGGTVPDGHLGDVAVLEALLARLPAGAVLFEESPSAKPILHQLIPARQPLGFVSAAMGGLGFALPAATGLRLARPDRPVIAVLGDGSALYGIHGLWSAAHYRIGVVYIVLANGRYAVMDQIAGDPATPPWPAFPEVSLAGLAESFGCHAVRIETLDELNVALDEMMSTATARTTPLLLDVQVAAPIGRQPDGATG